MYCLYGFDISKWVSIVHEEWKIDRKDRLVHMSIFPIRIKRPQRIVAKSWKGKFVMGGFIHRGSSWQGEHVVFPCILNNKQEFPWMQERKKKRNPAEAVLQKWLMQFAADFSGATVYALGCVKTSQKSQDEADLQWRRDDPLRRLLTRSRSQHSIERWVLLYYLCCLYCRWQPQKWILFSPTPLLLSHLLKNSFFFLFYFFYYFRPASKFSRRLLSSPLFAFIHCPQQSIMLAHFELSQDIFPSATVAMLLLCIDIFMHTACVSGTTANLWGPSGLLIVCDYCGYDLNSKNEMISTTAETHRYESCYGLHCWVSVPL